MEGNEVSVALVVSVLRNVMRKGTVTDAHAALVAALEAERDDGSFSNMVAARENVYRRKPLQLSLATHYIVRNVEKRCK